MKAFIIGRIKSLHYAFKGALLLLKTEHSIMVQTGIGLIVICLGFYFEISKQDWINQILALTLVLSIEGLNTAIEKLSDFVHPTQNQRIGFIKDIAAGAVTFAVLGAIALLIIIYRPYFL